jgi:hypothetical protein
MKPSHTSDISRYLENWQDEIESAFLYRTLAKTEKQPTLAEVYRKLAATEESHQILRYVWRPPSFMRGRKNELAALAAFILTVDRIEGCNKL